MQCFQLPHSPSLPIITTIRNRRLMDKADKHRLICRSLGRGGWEAICIFCCCSHYTAYTTLTRVRVPLGVYCGKLGRRKAQNKHRMSSWGLTFTWRLGVKTNFYENKQLGIMAQNTKVTWIPEIKRKASKSCCVKTGCFRLCPLPPWGDACI